MTDLNFTHERGLLRRQLKNDLVDWMRARDRDDRWTLADFVIRALSCKVKAFRLAPELTPEMVAEKAYGHLNHVQQRIFVDALKAEPRWIARAAVSPAQTTVAGWASELVQTGNFSGLLPSLAPTSVYSQLAERGLRISFDNGAGIIKLPARLTSPLVAGDFVGEGMPIPSRRLGLAAQNFGPPRKLAVISHFSAELQMGSVPTIENVLRQAMAEDTGTVLDAKLLDNVAASASRPAGLLNGVSPITASAGGGLGALSADLGALAAAISAPVDLVYLMTAGDRTRALALSPGLVGVPILVAPGLTPKTMIALDANDFASGEGDQPRFDISSEATFHDEDTSPLPLSAMGSPNTVAAPSHSAWQEDVLSLRMIWRVIWQMRRTGRVSYTTAVTW